MQVAHSPDDHSGGDPQPRAQRSAGVPHVGEPADGGESKAAGGSEAAEVAKVEGAAAEGEAGAGTEGKDAGKDADGSDGKENNHTKREEEKEVGKEEDEEEEEEECKICRCGEEEDLPLIRPCLCKGSIASVHDECLTAWLKVKRQVRYTEGRESPCYVCVCVCDRETARG